MRLMLFGGLIAILNQTLLAPALPSIMKEMQVDAATAQWLTTGFMLVNGIMIPVTAYLLDRFTTRKLFFISMGVFTIGTFIAGIATSFPVILRPYPAGGRRRCDDAYGADHHVVDTAEKIPRCRYGHDWAGNGVCACRPVL